MTDTDPSTTLASLTREYQALLEFVRQNPHSPTLQEDLAKAERLMQISWLRQSASL